MVGVQSEVYRNKLRPVRYDNFVHGRASGSIPSQACSALFPHKPLVLNLGAQNSPGCAAFCMKECHGRRRLGAMSRSLLV